MIFHARLVKAHTLIPFPATAATPSMIVPSPATPSRRATTSRPSYWPKILLPIRRILLRQSLILGRIPRKSKFLHLHYLRQRTLINLILPRGGTRIFRGAMAHIVPPRLLQRILVHIKRSPMMKSLQVAPALIPVPAAAIARPTPLLTPRLPRSAIPSRPPILRESLLVRQRPSPLQFLPFLLPREGIVDIAQYAEQLAHLPRVALGEGLFRSVLLGGIGVVGHRQELSPGLARVEFVSVVVAGAVAVRSGGGDGFGDEGAGSDRPPFRLGLASFVGLLHLLLLHFDFGHGAALGFGYEERFGDGGGEDGVVVGFVRGGGGGRIIGRGGGAVAGGGGAASAGGGFI
mmetsp:Transcript_16826/g.28966  ORF Transcript_16826/g.28966 Transcript_16826/m.28966 type:complete len:346 (-) Transcript_16826:814-1851(-)